jgi:hypothetical protein
MKEGSECNIYRCDRDTSVLGVGGRSGEEETEIYLTFSHEEKEILRSGCIMADQVKFTFLSIAACSPR